jgi:hypothetical protein
MERMDHVRRWIAALTAMMVLVVVSPSSPAQALAPGVDVFTRTWTRTDGPVADRQVDRTWMWGPGAFSAALYEPYLDAPGGQRVVQYFDKSRMEMTNPQGNRSHFWFVTNGLLVVELVSGRLQLGDTTFEARSPAKVNVAGDPNDPNSPTYATFEPLRSAPPIPDGAPVIARLSRTGAVTQHPTLADYGVTAAERVQVPGIDHQVASVFWAFMNATGIVTQDGRDTTAPLFQDPYYATGYPITEAYWTTVQVGGTPHDVLVQCFERRCLTYTPGNAPEWQVEMGNVGQHYYRWRYGTDIPTEPLAVDGPFSTRLAPTPLDVWPHTTDGLAHLRISNQTPYPMTIAIDGPVERQLTLPACDGCTIHPRTQPILACRDDVAEHDVLLPPGNYRIQVSWDGKDTDHLGGHWTLVPNSLLDTCWVLIQR